MRGHAGTIEAILRDPAFSHVDFDISWSEVAKYLVATAESAGIAADLMNRYPDRFLFGTDEVALDSTAIPDRFPPVRSALATTDSSRS